MKEIDLLLMETEIKELEQVKKHQDMLKKYIAELGR